MKYYIIAGEASGDLHGSMLLKALQQKDPQAEIYAWGGDKMAAAGAILRKHYKDLAFMGFVEVLKHLPTILKNFKFCHQDILNFNPDVIVLIDYPGFNLRLAQWAKKQGFKIAYYISPQVWAWKENRVKTIQHNVDAMMVILPFEQAFYKKWHYEVTYVGHPLMEQLAIEKSKQDTLPFSTDKPIIALLPGSRAQEIQLQLPIMLSVVPYFPQYQFVVAQAPSQEIALYQDLIQDKPVHIVKDKTYTLLKQAKAALVTSGTATLETALFEVPQVVCYKGNAISFWLAKKLVSIQYISLVNLILDKLAVKELIQGDLQTDNLRKALSEIVEEGAVLEQLRADYRNLQIKLKSPTGLTASESTAIKIVHLASS